MRQQGSSGWKYSLITTLCIAVLMAITISHRKSSSWSHYWYVQNSGIVKMFQGSQSLHYCYAIRRLSLNYMNYADLCRMRNFVKTLLLHCREWMLPGYCTWRLWGNHGGSWAGMTGAPFLPFSIAPAFIIKTCSWWQNEQKLCFDFYLCLMIVGETFHLCFVSWKTKGWELLEYEWCETCLSNVILGWSTALEN